ncbi:MULTISPECIES: hypothetical protein [unclassified Burkholderia]|uniref:Uncharacterized protein n=1 Tax=Burkholderia pyrrocinia TaxID=60550 RepID=A0A318I7X8_BURPY|nr:MULTISPECIES: hypothetical protein [unclassified Burkholderia]PXX26920.1 hypothetical protein NA66_102216 [Burkholderia pyrrocinia]SFW78818.1 hypothetical protein SAMN03159384_05036 [Burkholderia sp. NFACC33-1]SFY42581.1 hypothetical protein SAMN03159408_05271 [Burkholderia sp. NFPP32]
MPWRQQALDEEQTLHRRRDTFGGMDPADARRLGGPLDEFPSTDTLKDIHAPIQLWASESGGDGVEPETIPALAGLLPQRPEFRVVPNTAHFAFVAPCSDALKQIAPRICTDANGFDRAAFHRALDAKALAFFTAKLR